MALAFAQNLGNLATASATSLAGTFGSSTVSGNAIAVGTRVGAQGRTVTVTDNKSNGYSQGANQLFTTGNELFGHYALNISGGASHQVTVAISGAAASIRFTLHEESGVALTAALDQAIGNSGLAGGGTTADSGNVTTLQADEWIFGVAGTDGDAGYTAGAGYGNVVASPSGAGLGREASEDRIVAATGTYSASFTLSPANDWGCLVLTFKAAGAVAADVVGYRPVKIPNARVGPMALRHLFRRAVWPASSVATTPVSNTVTLAVEAAQGIVQTGVLPDESAQGISTSSAEPVESLQAIATTATDPVEANQGITAAAQDPVEATAGIASTAVEPIEALQAIASSVVEPLESLTGIATTASDPVESLQGIAATGSEPVEANKGLSTTASDPVEATGAVAATTAEPVESLQGISSTSSDPVEAQGNTPVVQTAVLPVESLAGGITAAPVLPIESLSTVSTTKQSPIEATGGVTAAPSAPVEALAGVTSSSSLPVESTSPVSRALVAAFEALAGIANAVIAPFESIRITPLSGPADTTRTRSGPAASGTAVAGGSGRTRTSPLSGLLSRFSASSGRTTTTPGDGETTTNLEG